MPCDDALQSGPSSPLAQKVEQVTINGKKIGNRFAVQPMEGWDGTSTGGATDDMLRRWARFGEEAGDHERSATMGSSRPARSAG